MLQCPGNPVCRMGKVQGDRQNGERNAPMTALPAVSALPDIRKARPGILGLADASTLLD